MGMKQKFITGDQAHAAIVEVATYVPGKTAICGGLAMAMYGSNRLTRDIDFLVKRAPDVTADYKRLSIGGISFDVLGIPADFIARGDEYEDLYEEARRTALVLPDSVLPVVLPEYLFVMKWEANRKKDLLDMATLIRLGLVTQESVLPLVRKFLGRGSAKPVTQFFLETEWRISAGLDDE